MAGNLGIKAVDDVLVCGGAEGPLQALGNTKPFDGKLAPVLVRRRIDTAKTSSLANFFAESKLAVVNKLASKVGNGMTSRHGVREQGG
jgi:hypothetical protein